MDSPPSGLGRIEWIGVRPVRREPLVEVPSVDAVESLGLEGDHRMSRKPDPKGKRHVTLFQWEHLPAIASFLGKDAISPSALRRNIGVSGINLLALNGKKFRIGTVEMEGTGLCHPCSRMEEIFGEGGYQAVRGHGGITARILCDGSFSVGDAVSL